MRTTRLTVLLCVLAATLAGCLKADDATVVKEDGSGTIQASYVIDVAKAEELVQAAAMMFGTGGPSGEAPKLEDRNPLHPSWFEEDAKAVEGYDIKTSAIKVDPVAKTSTTTVSGAFKTLEAAAHANAFFSGVTLSKVDKCEKVPNGGWKLTFKNIFTGDVMGMPMGDVLPMFEGQLKILKMVRKITLPTKILETNGKKSEDGKSVEWLVSYDKILEGGDLSMSVVFEAAEALKLKPFTYTPDLKLLQRRAMETPPGMRAKKKAAEKKPAEGDGGDDK